jgi:hypothetical protein
MTNIDLGSLPRDGRLQMARAAAIERYASVEQSLCMLFSTLLETKLDKAGVVFFRLTNTHSRNIIIDQLLNKQFGDKFRTYWHGQNNKSGLITLIRQLDSRRNEIVHWHVANEIHADGATVTSTLKLVPPNFWSTTPETPSILVGHLLEFSKKADFVQRSISMFCVMATSIVPDISADERAPWLRIFEQPCSYPPPDTHPLAQNPATPENQIPPSEA